jgi:hypothetical protein
MSRENIDSSWSTFKGEHRSFLQLHSRLLYFLHRFVIAFEYVKAVRTHGVMTNRLKQKSEVLAQSTQRNTDGSGKLRRASGAPVLELEE